MVTFTYFFPTSFKMLITFLSYEFSDLSLTLSNLDQKIKELELLLQSKDTEILRLRGENYQKVEGKIRGGYNKAFKEIENDSRGSLR